jgi:hypothetical protein
MTTTRAVALALAFGLVVPRAAGALELVCEVTRKVHPSGTYSDEHVKRAQFSVRIEETTSGAKLSRCSFIQSEQQVTCDAYNVDRVEYDPIPRIKKFYVFRGQFDVQLFPDMTFIENNGRGSVAFGKCRADRP